MTIQERIKAIKARGKKYKCFWCNHGFKELPEEWSGNSPNPGQFAKHKGCGSTIIVCPKCNRIVPTWSKEYNGSKVGKTHFHTRNWGSNKMLFGTKLVEADF